MSSREITLLGYGLITVVGVILGVVSHRSKALPRPGDVFAWTLRTSSGRIALFAVWAWLGLHFLG